MFLSRNLRTGFKLPSSRKLLLLLATVTQVHGIANPFAWLWRKIFKRSQPSKPLEDEFQSPLSDEEVPVPASQKCWPASTKDGNKLFICFDLDEDTIVLKKVGDSDVIIYRRAISTDPGLGKPLTVGFWNENALNGTDPHMYHLDFPVGIVKNHVETKNAFHRALKAWGEKHNVMCTSQDSDQSGRTLNTQKSPRNLEHNIMVKLISNIRVHKKHCETLDVTPETPYYEILNVYMRKCAWIKSRFRDPKQDHALQGAHEVFWMLNQMKQCINGSYTGTIQQHEEAKDNETHHLLTVTFTPERMTNLKGLQEPITFELSSDDFVLPREW